MPRKTAKRETATAESKTEVGTTRRSGRSVTKQEPAAGKEASRSRRGSTAAQTAASVADSKTPAKGRSSSPSEGRQKTRRESSEPRAKTARRSTSRVNYKESDGEEEVVEKKLEEDTFDSNEEFEDSESDEKSKPKAKGRAAKTPPKSRGSKSKAKSPRSRRGRPIKKQSSDEEEEEDVEPIELSEDSVEVDEVTSKKAKETTRSGRGRKSKGDDSEKKTPEEKPKSSRRSARAVVVKEESPRKRPTRGVQAKKYTEEDDDIEEIDDGQEEEAKPQDEGGRKRKRSSTTDSNKRLKEEESPEKEKEDENEGENEDADEKSTKAKPEVESEKEKEESKEESMEVDESDTSDKDNADDSSPTKTEKEVESKTESPVGKEDESKGEEKESSELNTSKENLNSSKKQESVDSSENLDESMQSFDSDQEGRAEQSASSGLEDSQDVKETKPVDTKTPPRDSTTEKSKSVVEHQLDSSNSSQEMEDSSDSKSFNESGISKEQKSETVQEKGETHLKSENSTEKVSYDVNVPPENKPVDTEKKPVAPSLSSPSLITHSKEANAEALNGSEKSSNSAPVIHSTKLHSEESAPTANGAHDLHNNSVSESDQYSPFPGRKYIVNAKLGENIRQSVKEKSFGFVSYNLGLSASDSSIQKEKLLNELNKLEAHIICIQQVSKPFYASILEPSLDALGFKGTFSQPEENEKGIATFYKSSLFRLSGQSEASLKHLIEKELEVSSLEPNDRLAVKTHVKKCGHVLFTHFTTVIGMHSLTVANVQVPSTDLSIHALQVSCLAREVVRINGGTSKPFLLGGEFNMVESEAPYQLLRDGYLSNDMIEELQRRKDVALPGKENEALVNLLWKSFQHPSSTLCSCYKSVLDHEVFIPEQKATSPDLLWYSSDSLYTIGVLDASETAAADRHFSLKADIAFSM